VLLHLPMPGNALLYLLHMLLLRRNHRLCLLQLPLRGCSLLQGLDLLEHRSGRRHFQSLALLGGPSLASAGMLASRVGARGRDDQAARKRARCSSGKLSDANGCSQRQ
jgi:hypothetical protein